MRLTIFLSAVGLLLVLASGFGGVLAAAFAALPLAVAALRQSRPVPVSMSVRSRR